MVLNRSMVNWGRGWGQSAMGICAFCYMWNFCSVVVFQRSMLNWRKGDFCFWYMCILLYVKLIWCSGFPEIYAQLEGGTSYLSVHIIWKLNLIVHFIWKLDLILILALRCHYWRGYILSQCALHLKTWLSCALHLKTWHNSDLGHQMPLPRGYILC